MSDSKPTTARFGTAAARWAGVGPYYAMFPSRFADEVVDERTKPGDAVLDIFAGRGTAVFSAASRGRSALGAEINHVGFVYANAKLKPAPSRAVLERLDRIAELSERYRERAEAMPEFFHRCFSPRVREFLLAARDNLNWLKVNADRVLVAQILVSLHGKRGQSLSNQMRQSSSFAPDYCARWWRERELSPPDVDPMDFLRKRLQWRYALGVPETGGGAVWLTDNRRGLPRISQDVREGKRAAFDMLLTSPPYCNITSYYNDQWLRLWMLGGGEKPTAAGGRGYGGKFASASAHRRLLFEAFGKCKGAMKDDAVVYVRTDRREPTYSNTLDALKSAFPDKAIEIRERPLPPARRTKAFSRGGAPKRTSCEVDIVMTPR